MKEKNTYEVKIDIDGKITTEHFNTLRQAARYEHSQCGFDDNAESAIFHENKIVSCTSGWPKKTTLGKRTVKSKAEMMARLRDKRKEQGLVKLELWLPVEYHEKVKAFAKELAEDNEAEK